MRSLAAIAAASLVLGLAACDDETAVEVDKVVAELTGDLFKGKDADAPLPTGLPAEAAPAAPAAPQATADDEEDDLDTMKARLQAL